MASAQIAHRAPHSGGFWRLYVLTWVGLAAVAMFYLVGVSLRPDLVAMATGGFGASPLVVADKDRAALAAGLDRLSQDIKAVRGDLTAVRSDVMELNSNVSTQATRVTDLSGVLEGLRQAVRPQVASAEPASSGAPEPASKTDEPVRSASPAEPIPPLPVRAPARPVRFVPVARIESPALPNGTARGNQPERFSPPATSRISTGSVTPAIISSPLPDAPAPREDAAAPSSRSGKPTSRQPQAITFGPPVVTTANEENERPAAGGNTAVRILTASSLNSLRISWRVLSQLHAAQLGALQPRYRVEKGAGGETFQLLAGPVLDRQQADALCTELKARGVFCAIDRYVGNVL